MDKDQDKKEGPRPGRVEALRELPADIMRSLTKEEVMAFLFEEEWPDSLKNKLRDYVVED